jgi:Tfp pilus assembly protein PilO
VKYNFAKLLFAILIGAHVHVLLYLVSVHPRYENIEILSRLAV